MATRGRNPDFVMSLPCLKIGNYFLNMKYVNLVLQWSSLEVLQQHLVNIGLDKILLKYFQTNFAGHFLLLKVCPWYFRISWLKIHTQKRGAGVTHAYLAQKLFISWHFFGMPSSEHKVIDSKYYKHKVYALVQGLRIPNAVLNQTNL